MPKTVHIIGAGISGLSAAVRLTNAGHKVHVHEATQQAGGRCRSYFDAATNLTIDNGNHLLLSGNRHALAYAKSIGTEAGLIGPASAQFLNVIESVFSGLSKSVIHHSDYPSAGHCRAAIDRYFKERNEHFALHPKKAGKKIWGQERTVAEFRDSHNCKDPAWR